MTQLAKRNVRVSVYRSPPAPVDDLSLAAAQSVVDAAAGAIPGYGAAEAAVAAAAKTVGIPGFQAVRDAVAAGLIPGLGTVRSAIAAASQVVASAPSQTPFRADSLVLAVQDLRVQFKITKSLTKTPNACDITITNLAKQTRVDLEKKPLTVVIEAGYSGVFWRLFGGDLLFSMSEIKGPNWETLLQIAEGSRAYNSARVSPRTYPPGSKVYDALKNAAKVMGFDLPKSATISDLLTEEFASGNVSVGPARDELTRLLAPYGLHWSMQDGKIQILGESTSSEARAHVISEQTGMIGTPEFGAPPRNGKPPHVKVKCLLFPELTPGGLVRVLSRALASGSGLFRIEKVTHTGDTHSPGDNSWATEVEIKPYNPTTDVPDVITPRYDADGSIEGQILQNEYDNEGVQEADEQFDPGAND